MTQELYDERPEKETKFRTSLPEKKSGCAERAQGFYGSVILIA